MFKNYAKIALRNILRHKGFSFINIFGLAIGIAGFLMILQYVTFELSYDNFHENGDQIYRVQLDQYARNELIFKSSENYPGVGPTLYKELPEVISYTRLYNLGSKNNVVIAYEAGPGEPIQFKHRRFLYADSTFLNMFSYPVLQGDPRTALKDPYTMVISESYARKYFGDEDPLGKMLRMRDDDYNDELCKVTAVVADPRPNTHLKFDVLISYNTLYTRFERAPERYNHTWERKDMYTYIQLAPGTDVDVLESKFAALVEQYNPKLKEQSRHDVLSLQPLRDIHLYSHLTDEAEINGDGNAVYFLFIIAFFIVAIAWVNYVNLSTARAIERAKEVGLRKVVGAVRGQLIGQFLAEALFINLLAILLGIALMFLALSVFDRLAGISLPMTLWQAGWFWLALAGLFVLGTFFAGGYPAFVLSSFQPIAVLRGSFSRSSRGAVMRKILVVFQFAASVALVFGTITVYEQLTYMQSRKLGYNLEQTLVVERPGIMPRDREQRRQVIDAFKTELRQYPNIRAATASSTVPGKKMRFKTGVRKYSDAAENAVAFTFSGVDFDFIDAFEMKMVSGRQFSQEYPTDIDTAAIITESAARLLGFQNPDDALGQTLAIDRFRWNPIVIGVITDYHQESLRHKIQPTLFYMTHAGAEYYMMKVNTTNLDETISQVAAAWERNFPGNPFHYFFLDDYFNQQYKTDQIFGKMFAIFATLAILVACLGLFGLSTFTAQQRTKEIGIRKVLGASVGGIVLLLFREIILLVMLANIIALPVIYYAMNHWLANFTYRIEIGWLLFAASAILVLLIALSTVSFETVRAALRNPTESLQYE